MTLSLATALARPWLHVAVDMQRLFAEPTVWHTPALADIAPRVVAIAGRAAARTVFTRFVTPRTADEAPGAWRDYYRRWADVTLERMDPVMLDLLAPLAALAPPARICDKTTHSAFNSGDLRARVADAGARTLVLSGVETEVCVLATALDAVDLGLLVVVVSDAVASSVPVAHRACLDHTLPRYDEQIVVASSAELLELVGGE